MKWRFYLFYAFLSSSYHLIASENLIAELEYIFGGSEFTVIKSLNGDFDGDGTKDIAAIVKYSNLERNDLVMFEKELWKNNEPESGTESALFLFLDKKTSLKSLMLTSGVSRFNTPTFTLLIKPNEGVVSLESDGEVLLLTDEAGINEYIYFKNGNIEHYVLEDIP